MAKATRYYSDDDSEIGVTPSQLKRFAKARQRDYLLHWFHQNFEDPAQETPYNSQEGGYQFIWGGPYDAQEEIESEFGSFISEQVIEEVVADVESDGISDWAPGRNHADHEHARNEWEAEQAERDAEEPKPNLGMIIAALERGENPRYGDVGEKDQRQEILDRLEQLERLLPAQTHGGIGHNNPPAEAGKIDSHLISDIREASSVIREELIKSEPNALEVAKATSRLSIALSWIGKKLDIAIDNFSKELGGTAGKAVSVAAAAYGIEKVAPTIAVTLNHVVEQATHWLSHIITQF